MFRVTVPMAAIVLFLSLAGKRRSPALSKKSPISDAWCCGHVAGSREWEAGRAGLPDCRWLDCAPAITRCDRPGGTLYPPSGARPARTPNQHATATLETLVWHFINIAYCIISATSAFQSYDSE